MFKVSITLTGSKIMAFLILGCAVVLDIKSGSATAFMFCLPFVSALIIGKQYMDKEIKLKTPSDET